VQTDWLLIRRLAAELDRALRGKRVRGAGRRADGTLGLAVSGATLGIDAFGALPLVTLDGDEPLENEPGFARTVSTALGGLRIDGIRARRGDRLIALECSASSRFGVTTRYRLAIELVPRFGNVVLLKDGTIVAAAKEFARAPGVVRATVVGDAYEPPPLAEPAPDSGEALASLRAALGDAAPKATRAASAALRVAVPLVPRLVAESLVFEARAVGAGAAPQLAERTVARAHDLVASTAGTPEALGDLYAYHDAGRLVQCHVVPLAQFAHLAASREPALAPLLGDAAREDAGDRSRHALAARREALLGRVAKRRATRAAERDALAAERDDVAARDALRRAGDALYAHVAEVPLRAERFVPPSDPEFEIALDPELDAKANAAAFFKRYRKATAALAHIHRRLDELAADARALDELAWELERADAESIEESRDALDRLERRRPNAPKDKARRAKPLDVRLSEDARVFVGRSPRGNADLTFRIARPDDLWFHARGMPGAHVVLSLDTPRSATHQELERAAELAAYHSKGRASDRVEIDYTERKHVRKQQNAPPGLVWYTHARTLRAVPRAEPE